MRILKKNTVNTVNEAIGTGLLKQSTAHDDTAILNQIAKHASDSIRCWAAYTIGRNDTLSIKQKLQQIALFAADSHFGVREISWMSVRPAIAYHLQESIALRVRQPGQEGFGARILKRSSKTRNWHWKSWSHQKQTPQNMYKTALAIGLMMPNPASVCDRNLRKMARRKQHETNRLHPQKGVADNRIIYKSKK